MLNSDYIIFITLFWETGCYKHHKIRGSLVLAIPRAEYMKISDKSTANEMFASLCANYEGSKKVREAKALMLVYQYELFMMKDDVSIEKMYSRF